MFTICTKDMADTIDSFNISHHFYADDSQLHTHTHTHTHTYTSVESR